MYRITSLNSQQDFDNRTDAYQDFSRLIKARVTATLWRKEYDLYEQIMVYSPVPFADFDDYAEPVYKKDKDFLL